MFHQSCIDRWFENHVHCPMCRIDIRDHLNSSINENETNNETNNELDDETSEINEEDLQISSDEQI